MTTEVKATELADGLRAMAAMIEAHPELVAPNEQGGSYSSFHSQLTYLLMSGLNRKQMAALTRAALAVGATVAKHQGDKYAGVDLHFGPVRMHVYTAREEVCERIVTGSEMVTRTVKDPEALAAVPEIEVTEEVETVEWRCMPLLADKDYLPSSEQQVAIDASLIAAAAVAGDAEAVV